MTPLKQILIATGIGILLGVGASYWYGDKQISSLKHYGDSTTVVAHQVQARLAFVSDSSHRVIDSLEHRGAVIDTQEVADSSDAADLDKALARSQTERDSLTTALKLAHADSVAAADARKERDNEHQKYLTALFLSTDALRTDSLHVKEIEGLNKRIQDLQAAPSFGHKLFVVASYVAAIGVGVKIGSLVAHK